MLNVYLLFFCTLQCIQTVFLKGKYTPVCSLNDKNNYVIVLFIQWLSLNKYFFELHIVVHILEWLKHKRRCFEWAENM